MGKYFGLIHKKIRKKTGKFQHFFRQSLVHVTQIIELKGLRREYFKILFHKNIYPMYIYPIV